MSQGDRTGGMGAGRGGGNSQEERTGGRGRGGGNSPGDTEHGYKCHKETEQERGVGFTRRQLETEK